MYEWDRCRCNTVCTTRLNFLETYAAFTFYSEFVGRFALRGTEIQFSDVTHMFAGIKLPLNFETRRD